MDREFDEYIRIGTNLHGGRASSVIIPDSIRDRHIYTVGKTRTGKSTLIANMALQDIENGHGVAVIDPHGDLVERDILPFIDEDSIQDVIYFDAADDTAPIALDIMTARTEREVSLLADDLLVTFKRFADSWGDRLENILRHTIHTLLSVPGSTFLDIHRILQNPAFRADVLRRVRHPQLQNFWQYEFPNLPKDATQPILNKMGRFLLSQPLRSILGQRSSSLDFSRVLGQSRVLLVNLAKGKIGEENSRLIGSLFVSQIQLAAMRRASDPREQRPPFALYVDEFQNFTTSAFDIILSEAGKYRLWLTMAHQFISQLDRRMRDAILGNVGTIVMFSLGPPDAHELKDELGRFTPQDLVNLDRDKHEAFCRPATRAADTFPFQTLPPPDWPDEDVARRIIDWSREVYGGVVVDYVPEVPQPPPPPRMVREEVATPPPAPAEVKAPPAEPPDPDRRPLPADKPPAGTIKERILLYVSQAEYLSTQQIIELCFSHYSSEGSRKANAAAALKQLIEAKQIKSQAVGRGNIYFVGRPPNVTPHNLAVRSLYVKIARSGFEITAVKFFFDGIPGLSPDLYVVFGEGGGEGIHTYWEYDTGTEGLAEIETKVSRYVACPYDRLAFIAATEQRRAQLAAKVKAPRTVFATLDAFQTLTDPAFYGAGENEPRAFFISS